VRHLTPDKLQENAGKGKPGGENWAGQTEEAERWHYYNNCIPHRGKPVSTDNPQTIKQEYCHRQVKPFFISDINLLFT